MKDNPNGGGGGEAKPEINEDIFGATYDKKTGARVVVEPEVKEEKVDTNALDEAKMTPVEKELRRQLEQKEKDLKSLGGNLSKQRESFEKQIEEINKKLDTVSKGENKDANKNPDLPYKDVKFSKDLTDDERDEMTSAEIRMMDQLAEMQKKENERFLADFNKSGDAKPADKKEDKPETGKIPENFETNVKTFAMEMTGGDTAMANKIIAEFNQFAENYKLDEDGIRERLEKASKLVSGFTQKPTKTINGSPAGEGKSSWIDDVVKTATGGNRGGGKKFTL